MGAAECLAAGNGANFRDLRAKVTIMSQFDYALPRAARANLAKDEMRKHTTLRQLSLPEPSYKQKRYYATYLPSLAIRRASRETLRCAALR